MSKYILVFISAYLFNLFLTSIVHFIAFFQGTEHKADVIFTKFFVLPEDFLEFIYYSLSLDYWSAKSFKKNKLLNKRAYSGNFIRSSNCYNFIISLLIFLVVINLNDIKYLDFFKFSWGIRVFSRSFEIMIAFVRDVIDDGKKRTDIISGERIKLAIYSYFEIIINFSVFYYLLSYLSDEAKVIKYVFESIGISTFTGVNFSYPNYNLYYNLFIILQLFTSISLVYFALANYISEKK
ncbi:MAG: hypothetical protein ACOCRK_03540 [bacterium]